MPYDLEPGYLYVFTEGACWRSPDGLDWEEVAPSPSARPQYDEIVELARGRMVVSDEHLAALSDERLKRIARETLSLSSAMTRRGGLPDERVPSLIGLGFRVNRIIRERAAARA